MFLNSKPTRLAPSAKSRLNTHAHKLDNIEPPRKRSPDGIPGSPLPSEVLVFNTSQHGGAGATRAGHYNRSLPEVPNYEEIQRFMKQSWDERIAKIKDPNCKLKVLWMKSYAEEEREREQLEKKESQNSSSSSTSQPSTPKQKNSPQHNSKK
jgi:hypothetical protein